MYPNLLNLFFKFPPWTLSRVCTVVSLAVGTDGIFCACLAIMVWKTTAGTDKFATTCVLSMPKPLTFKTTQGIWDERFNWYIKVTSFDGRRKDGYIEGQDKGICR